MAAAAANYVTLKGSHRNPAPNSQVLGPADPDQPVDVTVYLRRRAPLPAAVQEEAMGNRLPADRKYLSRARLAAAYGADPADIAAVEAFAAASNLTVVHTSQARRIVQLSGTVDACCAAFHVKLHDCQHTQGGTFRGRTGSIMIPDNLADIIVGIFGLDNRPQAQAHFLIRKPGPSAPTPRATNSQFTPLEIAHLYNFPSNLNGSGECIAIIELGGGYNTSDLQAYFSGLGIAMPSVSSVSVDGGANSPTGSADGPDGEVMLDIEIAGAIAPSAKIVVYFCPNTDQGFLDGVTQAVHDTNNKPSVISISWGSAEVNWTTQAMEQFDQAFQDAATLGVTVCVAAGDNGSSDGVNDGQAHVDFPASSPNALACGGTQLNASSTTISSEVVWNDPNDGATGGGVSSQFPLPAYQDNAGVPPSVNPGGKVGRGVPDVAANADPATGYSIRADGQDAVVGGTSAVAPLWAGLTALFNQGLGHSAGLLNTLLYGSVQQQGAFRDITSGNNGAYSAGPGWDACSGLGVADGTKVYQALSK
jgi:kumamolisin